MRIVVLAGGNSTEREVSLSSGSMIYKALKEKGHLVILLDVYLGYRGETDGIFEARTDCTDRREGIGEEILSPEEIKGLRGEGERGFFGPNVIALCSQADVVFLGLHGANGEDGRIQAAFDLCGIRYTGTDYVSSALCMDKGLTKEMFRLHGIPTPGGTTLKLHEEDSMQIPFPCVVKSCNGGSSVGVSIAATQEEYRKAKEEAFRYDREIVIEQYIRGREFSVGVMEGRALPVIEIRPLQGFYDYKNKYQAGSAVETCPADLPREISEKMQGYAEAAFRALRLKCYARMDFMMSEEGEIYCLEANTLPGMTPTSLLPQEAAAEGMDFSSLCEAIIRAAMEKDRV
ncbi:MAG: D-alanine--D-alanine ligase [Lachnospiraceae bacterium]|nr:D-alanine--D-alanine ligase [Lachnospiraceae bacterium]